MRHIYYYVPPCPDCGSRRTGRYMKQPFMDAGRTRRTNLLAGELIKFARELPDKNLYCADCGHEWSGTAEFKLWPKERIDAERKTRKTEDLYNEYVKREQELENESIKARRFFKKPEKRDVYEEELDQTLRESTKTENSPVNIPEVAEERETGKKLRVGYRNVTALRRLKKNRGKTTENN